MPAAPPTGSTVLDEVDLGVVHALQIAPRASWTELAAVLDYSAVTLARRWRRLRSEGLAWVTGSGSPALWAGMAGALVRIEVADGAANDVLGVLARDPRTKAVYRFAGKGTVLAHLIVPDPPGLNGWRQRVATLPGVLGTDMRLVTGTHRDARTWRLDVLSPAQQRELRPRGPAAVESRAAAPPARPERFRALLHALGRDGRASAMELARATGWPRTTVQRRLADLIRSGLLATRCDVAQEAVGYPVTLWLFGSVEAAALTQALRNIAALPEVRLLLTTTGPDNVVVGAWLRKVEQTLELENTLAAVAPSLRVRDREVALRKTKIQGWILDEAGRAVEAVPIDPWARGGR